MANLRSLTSVTLSNPSLVLNLMRAPEFVRRERFAMLGSFCSIQIRRHRMPNTGVFAQQGYEPVRRPWHRHAGFSMLELVIVIAILLVIAAMTAPKLVTIIEQERMQNATRAYASFLQQCRYRSEGDAQWYQVLFDNSDPSSTIAYLDINGDGQRQSTEPAMEIPAPITLIDPLNTSIPTFNPDLIGVATLLSVDTTPATWTCRHATSCSNPTQIAGLEFNERGLPCQLTSATAACTNTTLVSSGTPPVTSAAPVAWINYFSYPTSAGGTNYAAVTITPAGRIKVWSYQGTSGGGGSWN